MEKLIIASNIGGSNETIVNEKTGLFRANGSWISGELKECDPQMCNWIAGPQLGSHRLVKADE